MNSTECNRRASECAENAAVAVEELVSLEFLRLAAQWRSMAVRQIFLGFVDVPAAPQILPKIVPLPIA